MRKIFLFLLLRPVVSFALLLGSLSILHSQFFISPALAQSDFSTRFTSIYDISNEGVAHVTHQIELTNRLSEVYASEYTLTIGSTRVKDISAQSPSGVETSITTKENSTQITLKFKNPVVGKNQTHRFSVSYTNLDIATKSGRVLEVNIPKMGNSGEVDDFSAVIQVPDSFDAPTIMTPVTKSITLANGKRILRYSKSAIANKSISILFGDHQVYDFTLRYTLTNPSLTTINSQVALPPDTAYQKLYYQNLDPSPQNFTVDRDGNWLAEYSLKPRQTLEVRTSGQAVLYLKPTLPTEIGDPSQYLGDSAYWQVQDPEIQVLGQQLKTPENIYNYLVSNFTYNYARIDAGTTRLGAKAALEDPKNAICTEFTDLFVALARAAGIPARSQDGFAFTANSKLRPLSLKVDVLHAWPQYFDSEKNQWIPVDPTWGNTSSIDYFSRWDLNHFAFVIHGQDSVTPYPAGAYKLSSSQGKDVNVAFSLSEPTETVNVDTQLKDSKIVVKNLGNVAGYQIPVSYNNQVYTTIPILPPFANFTYDLSPNFFSPAQIATSITAGFVAALVSLSAYLTWRLLISRRR